MTALDEAMMDQHRGWPPVDHEERTWTARPDGHVPRKDRRVAYRSAVPPLIADAELSLPPSLYATVEQATTALARLDAAEGLDQSIVPLLRTESVASSKIERIEVSQRHVGRALADLPTRQRSASEVAANVRAVRQAVEASDDGVTVESICATHRTLMHHAHGAGELRTVQSWIGGSDHSPRDARYVPPRHELVPDLLDDLVRFAGRTDLPALAQAAVAHAQFEVVHPFEDGNGRTGRTLVHVLLRRRGIVTHGIAPISLALLARRDDYYDALTGYEQGDAARFVALFAESAATAARAGAILARELSTVRREWEAMPVVAKSRSDATVRRIVGDLTAHPVCDAAQVAARHGVSEQASRRALEALHDAGVLGRASAARNHHVYEAHDVFDALDEVERQVREGRL